VDGDAIGDETKPGRMRHAAAALRGGGPVTSRLHRSFLRLTWR
jgi:hypothetical protein